MKTNKILVASMILFSSVAFLGSCSSDDSKPKLPAIGGYDSADDVAALDLVAYWPLDGDGIESKSSIAPTSTMGTTWTTGVKGEGASMTAGFLKFPTIAALNTTMTSFSISTWFKVQNNGTSSSVFVSLTRPNEWAGNVNFMAETAWQPATSDSLTVKGLIVSNNDLGWQDSRNAIQSSADDLADGHVAFPNKIGGTWAHGVITYDNDTQLFKVYVNGVKISNPKWEFRGNGSAAGVPVSFTLPSTVMIGALGDVETSSEPWNKGLTGQLDEIRIYKKALVGSDVNSLYELELAGR